MSFDSPGEAADILMNEGYLCDDLCISVPDVPSEQFKEAVRYLGWAGLAAEMNGEDGPWIDLHECLHPGAEFVRAVHQRQAARGQF